MSALEDLAQPAGVLFTGECELRQSGVVPRRGFIQTVGDVWSHGGAYSYYDVTVRFYVKSDETELQALARRVKELEAITDGLRAGLEAL
jgi:hypothetical protein